ncbi:MAG: flagellar protein FlaG [Lachnospiraceae bacterium]|nr:flagellar protein FlaG [Lachnospiraceae bacterium]
MAIEALKNPLSVFQAVNSGVSATSSSQEVMRDAVTVQKVNAGEQNAQQPEEDTSEQGRYEVENAANVSPDKVKKAVEQINQKIRPTHTSCQFSYHEETNRISIKVINDKTDEVIREIPPEKTLDIIAKTLELEGILVDEKR